jgi:hypothetical protein
MLPTSITNCSMASPSAFAPLPLSRTDSHIPPLPWPGSNWTFMVLTGPDHPQALCICLEHLVIFCFQIMSRQRGRPRRGSPWHPPRPRASVSPPGSPSTISSPPLQSELAPLASSTSPVSRFDCLAIIESLSGSSLRHLVVPPNSRTINPSHAPVTGSSRPPMGAPPPVRTARNNTSASTDSTPDLQLKESFTILYGLVFELRQGMEDLQFRLQLMDGRISTLLQILSTFQDAFPSNPAGAASAGVPHTESDDRNAKTQSVAEVVVEQVQHEDMEADDSHRPACAQSAWRRPASCQQGREHRGR